MSELRKSKLLPEKNSLGWFFSFEGGEGAGKSTLIESLYQEFQRRGCRVVWTREPGGTKRGEAVREILLKKMEPGDPPFSPYMELALFLASRAQQVEEVIRPALKRGEIVFCDRFNDSSIVYQGIVRGLGKEEVEEVAHFFSQGIEPDLTFYLDIEPEEGLKRASKRREADRIEAEKAAFHERIRQGYLSLVKDHPERLFLLDAALPPQQVFSHALEAIDLWMEPIDV